MRTLLFLVFALSLFSCNENILNSEDFHGLQDTINYEKSAKIVDILSAKSSKDIPAKFFRVASMYKENYVHLKQPDGKSCSWTTYVNCINCIVTANNDFCYSTSISTIRKRCSNKNKYPNSISALVWYAQTYDDDLVDSYSKSFSSRWTTTKFMLNFINENRVPFVVISSLNGVGHYRLVFSIDWKQSESKSIVYYTDCAYSDKGSFDSNIKTKKLSDFLDSMVETNDYYNMLFMTPYWFYGCMKFMHP